MSGFGDNVRLLQALDRWIGVPACLLATACARLARLGRGRTPPAPPRRLLFIKLAEQGSTVLAFDALQRAVARVGPGNVHFLVFDTNRAIVDLLQIIPPANVLALETRSPWALVASTARLLREIRRRQIDGCIDLNFFGRFTALLTWLTGARVRVGHHAYGGDGPARGDLLTHCVPHTPHLHTSRAFTSLVLALDHAPENLPALPFVPPAEPAVPCFTPTAAETAAARELLRELGIGARQRLILLNANASDLLPVRKWAGENYVELARRLLAEFPEAAVAFTGAASELPATAALVRAVDSARCHCLAGRTTLRQLLVVFGLAEVLVTNDSGPAHFAAMTPIDVVVLFGPETPALFSALGPRIHPVWLGLACAPCVTARNHRQTSCRDNQCMKQIRVEDVFTRTAHLQRLRTAPGT